MVIARILRKTHIAKCLIQQMIRIAPSETDARYTQCRQIEAIEIELFGCPLREDAETLATPLDWPPHRLLPWFLL